VVINSGATFEMNGHNLSINALSGTGTLNQRSNGTKTLTFGYGDASGSFSGVLSNVLTGSGVAILNVSKTGAGTQVLTGPNTYIGVTTVNQGILQLGASNTIPGASGVVLAGGKLATAGFSDTVGTLGVTANSHLDLGSGASTLHFANSSAMPWSGMLTIDNWSGSLSGGGTDQIFVGTGASALTKSQLANIVFAGSGMLNSTLLSTGELVPGRTFVPGDFDRDNFLSVADMQAMLTALVDVSTYEASRNLSANDLIALGDLNGDARLDNADVEGLIITLANAAGGGTLSAVPEPPTIILALLALTLLATARYR
jgi:autotransporter-associated beta strand protein